MNPFQSLLDYEEFVYTLQQSFSPIKSSSLVVIRRGKRVAVLHRIEREIEEYLAEKAAETPAETKSLKTAYG